MEVDYNINRQDWPRVNITESPISIYADSQQWPKISIVTPSFNQGEYIEETILSVINQNYSNLEYIIIDGGSTDNTIEIVKKYEKYITYWISEPDRGQSHAINKGLAVATGDIFNWVNSDDYYRENALEAVGRYFKDKGVDILSGYSRRFYSGSDPEDLSSVILARTAIHRELEKDVLFHYFIQVSTFFRRSVVEELGGLNRHLHFVMDSELWLKYLMRHGYDKIYFTDQHLANYRLHPSSKTVAQQQKFREEMGLVYRTLYRQLGFSNGDMNRLNPMDGPRSSDTSGEAYEVSGIAKKKLRKYAYWKALEETGGVQSFDRFFNLLIKAILFSPFSLNTYKQIIFGLLVPRLRFKIKRK